MPFGEKYIDQLNEAGASIHFTQGWGWQFLHDGLIRPAQLPARKTRVAKIVSWISRDGRAVGFKGRIEGDIFEPPIGSMVCLLQTSEHIGEKDKAPVSLHFSNDSLALVEDALSACGLRPVWEGCQGVIGYGILEEHKP